MGFAAQAANTPHPHPPARPAPRPVPLPAPFRAARASLTAAADVGNGGVAPTLGKGQLLTVPPATHFDLMSWRDAISPAGMEVTAAAVAAAAAAATADDDFVVSRSNRRWFCSAARVREMCDTNSK